MAMIARSRQWQDAFFETIGGGMVEAWEREGHQGPQDAILSDAAGQATIERGAVPVPTATRLQHDGRCLGCGALLWVGRMYCNAGCRAKERAAAERAYRQLPKVEPSNTQDLF